MCKYEILKYLLLVFQGTVLSLLFIVNSSGYKPIKLVFTGISSIIMGLSHLNTLVLFKPHCVPEEVVLELCLVSDHPFLLLFTYVCIFRDIFNLCFL